MGIKDRLASSQNRKDEQPNIELALDIIATKNEKSIAELVELLGSSKAVQNDSIKVLYEVGVLEPQLIEPHWNVFLQALQTKNNRLQWGAMTALNQIVRLNPEVIYKHLDIIMETVDKGSVITRDQAVYLLIYLAGLEPYKVEAYELLREQLLSCPTNQLPMYAEKALKVVDVHNKSGFTQTLESRLPEVEKESKKKRILKVLDKVSKL
ncbi:hypothetical protein KFE94_01730 [bacterium SCSIO 12643]|nr:hypothetical protein KFE94_01730 [bacterium SCSIO 12643]